MGRLARLRELGPREALSRLVRRCGRVLRDDAPMCGWRAPAGGEVSGAAGVR